MRRGVARQVARGEVAGVVEDRRAFQPGWEDLFRMTQQQVRGCGCGWMGVACDLFCMTQQQVRGWWWWCLWMWSQGLGV